MINSQNEVIETLRERVKVLEGVEVDMNKKIDSTNKTNVTLEGKVLNLETILLKKELKIKTYVEYLNAASKKIKSLTEANNVVNPTSSSKAALIGDVCEEDRGTENHPE